MDWNSIWHFIFGRLTMQDFVHDPIMAGAGIMEIAALVIAAGLVTYLKKWRYLWKNWFTSLDPKKIGIMYFIIAVVMLVRGLIDALMIKAQQATATPDAFLSPDHFQQIFSAHGTIMIFFVAMAMIFAMFNLLVPPQIGARDVAFPLLNSISFWLFVAGMVIVNAPLIVGEFSNAGWLAYPPLSELQYDPGTGVDYWIWALQIAGIGSLLSGINFFTTILKMRTKGMKMMKMPIFVWSTVGATALIMAAFPILTVTLALLALDRTFGTNFFTSYNGGNPMMYVNLIWAWGHPEVYILVLPAFGAFSEIVATFSRKKLFGYTSMVWALIAITFLSFTVWLHHFFTMGAGADVNTFFGIMTMIIAIPTGVKIFNWIFTMYRGRVRFTTPMLWFMGFVTTFAIGGVTGVMLSVPPSDFQFHNSLFLVAHFHNTIIGGVLFGVFAAITYWWPKFTGFYLNEKIGRYAFIFWISGFILAFTPLYILGFMGAVRRLDHYDPSLGWQGLFIVSGIGVLLIIIGVGFQIFQVIVSILQRKQNPAPADAWDGRTLEWSMSSPPKEYNFAVLPEVSTRDAFWEQKLAMKNHTPEPIKYQDIRLPKPSFIGPLVGGLAMVFGMAVVWHVIWAVLASLFALIIVLVVRLLRDHDEQVISAAKVAKMEAAS